MSRVLWRGNRISVASVMIRAGVAATGADATKQRGQLEMPGGRQESNLPRAVAGRGLHHVRDVGCARRIGEYHLFDIGCRKVIEFQKLFTGDEVLTARYR